MRRTSLSDQPPSGTEVKPDPDSSARTTDSGNPPFSSSALGTRADAHTPDPSPTPDDGAHMESPTPPALHSLAIAGQDSTMASRATPATATPVAPTPATRTPVQASDRPSTSKAPPPPVPEIHHQRGSSSFTTYRTPASASSPPRVAPSAPADVAHLPVKRARRDPQPRIGILATPAHPPTLLQTPDNYWNPLVSQHPWAKLIVPLPERTDLSNMNVTSELPTTVYRHLGKGGYFGARFVKSLFPRKFKGTPSPTNQFPIMEMMRIEHAIDFRHRAQLLIDDVLQDRYHSVDPPLPPAPRGIPPSLLYPPLRKYTFPVLYQVVAKGHGQGVIVEAKNFFVPGPDHCELHCIVFDQFAVNLMNDTRGFDLSQLSIKDFIWVYSIKPTRKACRAPAYTLRQSRYPRATAMDTSTPYFFRVHEFVFVTPPSANKIVLGIVLSVARRGQGTINNIRIALEGCPEPVTVSPSICQFPLEEIDNDDLVLAETRANVSCAMRFSEPPISIQAQDELVNHARRFLPAHPAESILPLRVFKPTQADMDWIADRRGAFLSYKTQPGSSRKRMAQLFSMACSALAATNVMGDDKSTHQVTATVPSLASFPLRLRFQLTGMSSESGWELMRPVDIWILNSSTVGRTLIKNVQFSSDTRSITVELHTTISCHRSVLRAIQRRTRDLEEPVEVDICVKLARLPTGTDPVYELLASENLFSALRINFACRANEILDAVYGGRPRPAENRPPAPSQPPMTVTLGAARYELRPDQVQAVQMGSEDHAILAVQAAFGTGKTVVGALIAARQASPNNLVVATTTTNTAVAQFTDTILRLTDYRHLDVLRFVSDSALMDGAPTTPADLHTILKQLGTRYRNQLSSGEIYQCEAYARGRELIETMIFEPEQTLHLTDEQREEYRIAEREISDATEEAVAIMFRVRRPAIVCMTTASLLNASSKGGIFQHYLDCCTLIVADEASQIPEPAFVAITGRFDRARQIYIGDVNQLEPHVRCPRSSKPALFGAQGVMGLLLSKDIPLAPLTTTFRAHPELNALPNELFYDGLLVSGTDSTNRRLLLDVCRTPNPDIPLVVVDVQGSSERAPSGSHSNATEAQVCRDIVQALLAKHVPASSVGIITFYKEQYRLLERYASQQGVFLHTVDSVQGREVDVVILLTTRTNIDAARSEFLDDKLRMNVAITRCRHGQFILGQVSALQKLPNWGRLTEWAGERGVIVSTATLPDLFE